MSFSVIFGCFYLFMNCFYIGLIDDVVFYCKNKIGNYGGNYIDARYTQGDDLEVARNIS